MYVSPFHMSGRWTQITLCLVESLVKAVDAHVPSISLLVTLRRGPAHRDPRGHNGPWAQAMPSSLALPTSVYEG